MQSGSERRALRRRRQSGRHAQAASRAVRRQSSVTLHERRDRRQGDLVMLTERLGHQPGGKSDRTAGALVHDAVNILAQAPAMAFMTSLGPTRAGLVPLRLAIRRRRPGRRTRRLDRQLQPKHQLGQLSVAQTLKIVPAHTILNQRSPCAAKGWVITSGLLAESVFVR